jgi:hypothetical protein
METWLIVQVDLGIYMACGFSTLYFLFAQLKKYVSLNILTFPML